MLARRMEQGNGQRQRQCFPYIKCIITSAGRNVHFEDLYLENLKQKTRDKGPERNENTKNGTAALQRVDKRAPFQQLIISQKKNLVKIICPPFINSLKKKEMINSDNLNINKRLRPSMQRSSSLKKIYKLIKFSISLTPLKK